LTLLLLIFNVAIKKISLFALLLCGQITNQTIQYSANRYVHQPVQYRYPILIVGRLVFCFF